MANRIFFILMALSSALGFGKVFTIAILLSTEDFGRYSILIAIALFLSPLPGMGLIEETRKMFPRLFVDDRQAEIVSRADHISRVVALRMAIPGVAISVLMLAFGWMSAALIAAALTLVAFGGAWTSILASALRAGKSPLLLGVTASVRAALTIPATLLAGHYFGLIGVVWGEAVAAVLGGVIMRVALRPRQAVANLPARADHSLRASRDGLLVFLGSALVAAPIYLNRPVAALALSPTEVGTLSFLLVLVGAYQTAIAICDQIMGPRLVHWQHSGMLMAQQKRRFLLLVAALSAISLASFAVIWLAMLTPLVSPLVEKYQVTGSLVLPAAFLAALNITSTADWMLQAHDREKFVTLSSAVNLAAFAVLAALVIAGTIAIESFLWGLAIGKLIQLVVQLVIILRIEPAPAA